MENGHDSAPTQHRHAIVAFAQGRSTRWTGALKKADRDKLEKAKNKKLKFRSVARLAAKTAAWAHAVSI